MDRWTYLFLFERVTEAEGQSVDMIGFLLAHRTSLDGLSQKFVDSIRRLMLMETGVALL
jgi:hypothetical protein